ncbi:MAG: 8-amino-7-oxononanoate synthase [Candidatus Eremiobacteraeota bacterium]|nr:8-amino-7-oxononanoate synthase [Candidatus Eremiobacteraeota bacterium]
MSYLERIDEELAEIRRANRYREVATHQLAGAIDFSSNDYLGLSSHPQVVQALKNASRAGSGGARLLGGRHREHSLLEEELASWLGRERALLFSSGYHAAIGTIPVLARSTGSILSDERNHASLIDGIRLARAPRTIYPHGNPPSHEGRQSALLVSESIFSMDGDTVHPRDLLRTLGPGDVLFIDAAHALGVVGPQGAGLDYELDDPRVIVMGTLSKAFGAHGGFVAGPARAIDLLANTARTFIFDTALPPAIALAARIALTLIRRADDGRASLRANVDRVREGLRALGLPTIETASPIVPVVVGEELQTLELSRRLLERGVYAPAIRPPTVPPGGSRLRLSIRSDHTPTQIDVLLRELKACLVTS